MRAAVLAAGRGLRMGGGTPKALLPIRGNSPLLYFVLRALTEGGIQDLVVVTGHRPQEVQDYVGEKWSGKAQFVWNTRYASWGNFHSVRMALEQSPGTSLLVMNSDIVIHPGVITRTLATDGDLVLAVQRRKNLDREDMRVELSGDQIRAIGKDLKGPRSHGEFAGVSLIRPSAARLYQEMATNLEWSGDVAPYYEDVYNEMTDRLDVRASSVEVGEYAEVDTPEDQQRATEVANQHFPRESQPAVEVG